MTTARILVVDDESPLRSLVRPYLEAEGYEVLEASNGPQAVEIVRDETIHLAIVDVMLPGFDGIEVVKRIRETSGMPVILLTARREEGERVAGLRLGADDYVTKPFSVPELVARVSAQLRRSGWATGALDERVVIGDIEIDPTSRKVWVDGVAAELTRREFDLLLALTRRPNRVISRSDLLNEAWPTTFVNEKTVDVHVAGLRRKLGPSLDVTSIRGVGYRLETQ
ncbi:MAG TPA: response regulator transcription factor [Acidimicrobiales bacterium]|nr:response regulator transcription factor [Acidimicrobiales bacterium]